MQSCDEFWYMDVEDGSKGRYWREKDILYLGHEFEWYYISGAVWDKSIAPKQPVLPSIFLLQWVVNWTGPYYYIFLTGISWYYLMGLYLKWSVLWIITIIMQLPCYTLQGSHKRTNPMDGILTRLDNPPLFIDMYS